MKMIDFYRKADEKRRDEIDFVPDAIEEKFMLLLVPRRRKSVSEQHKTSKAPAAGFVRPRVFCDVFYEHA